MLATLPRSFARCRLGFAPIGVQSFAAGRTCLGAEIPRRTAHTLEGHPTLLASASIALQRISLTGEIAQSFAEDGAAGRPTTAGPGIGRSEGIAANHAITNVDPLARRIRNFSTGRRAIEAETTPLAVALIREL